MLIILIDINKNFKIKIFDTSILFLLIIAIYILSLKLNN